jgi:hypothetical protein
VFIPGLIEKFGGIGSGDIGIGACSTLDRIFKKRISQQFALAPSNINP